MPLRSRDANIGRMPKVIGLPFALMVTVGIIAVVAVLLLIVLAAFIGAGWYSLWVLVLPVIAYAVCFTISKKYGEFYAARIGKVAIKRVKTWTWLHEMEDKILMSEIKKKEQKNVKV